jgi:predicted transglutaminase-like cysteine proteinase
MKRTAALLLTAGVIASLILTGCLQITPATEPAQESEPPPATEPIPAQTTTPAAEAPTADYSDILYFFAEAERELNHAEVYLNNGNFSKARQSIVDAQLQLSDAETRLSKADLSQTEEEDARLAISCANEVLVGYSNMIDVLEAMESDAWLTWGPYHEIIDSITEARARLTTAQEIASRITDQTLLEGMELAEFIANIDEMLEQLQAEELLIAIKVYTYIEKIDPESVRDLAIEITEDATTDKKAVTAIFDYVRDTINYVNDPRVVELDFDYVQSPLQTIQRRAGDCDDHAVLLASMLEAIGYSTTICFVDTDEEAPLEPNHMNIIVTIDDREYILEATCKTCDMGEYPGEMYYQGYDYAEFKTAMLEAMGQGV